MRRVVFLWSRTFVSQCVHEVYELLYFIAVGKRMDAIDERLFNVLVVARHKARDGDVCEYHEFFNEFVAVGPHFRAYGDRHAVCISSNSTSSVSNESAPCSSRFRPHFLRWCSVL